MAVTAPGRTRSESNSSWRNGRRPVFGEVAKFQNNPHWRDCLLFDEYFHGDDGAGLVLMAGRVFR
ncbi:hypothetical protein [Methanoculleus sp. 10]|jgi:hypothetical protein|uniref:hypothetical protein n=1 Tax=Methanoculleus sp. 10 TaxID=430615 RepID=UPI001B69CE5B|nr:hypothetical protein [Methanoculleus sp. 10]MBP7411028.1 hypothetical protein [Methanoculleus sp.]